LFAYPSYILAVLAGKKGKAAFQKTTKYVFQLMFFLSPSIKKITVVGKENLAKYPNFVITPTHRSFLDYLLIESIIHDIVLFTNKPLTRFFLYRHVSNLLGAHVAKGDTPAAYFGLFEEFKRHLKNGTNVLIFPEGTRNHTDILMPFKEGAFKLSVTENIPILPIVILGSDKIYQKGSMLSVNGKSAEILIEILEPMFAKDGEGHTEFTQRVKSVLQQRQNALLKTN
jgi:1-acyl-sn-glycerol-3-phosphate acyltransferase